MTHHQLDLVRADREQWLKLYYFIRAAFSVAWVVAAFAVGPSSLLVAAIGTVTEVGFTYLDAREDLPA